jgi:hypothetical protein
MKNIHAMAGGSVGYVRGLASVRCGGVAFPLDLVRAVAKTAARLAVRRRVGAAFAGYLVTEPAAFSSRRWLHDLASVAVTGRDMTRARDWRDGAAGEGFGGLDAPDWIASGSCVLLSVLASGLRLSRSSFVSRGES